MPSPNYHLLAAKHEPHQKADLFTKNTEDFFLGWGVGVRRWGGGEWGEWACRQKKRTKQNENSKRSGQKSKKADSKLKSNDGREIPDKGGDIRHAWPLFGEPPGVRTSPLLANWKLDRQHLGIYTLLVKRCTLAVTLPHPSIQPKQTKSHKPHKLMNCQQHICEFLYNFF